MGKIFKNFLFKKPLIQKSSNLLTRWSNTESSCYSHGPGAVGATIKKSKFTCVYMGNISQYDSGERYVALGPLVWWSIQCQIFPFNYMYLFLLHSILSMPVVWYEYMERCSRFRKVHLALWIGYMECIIIYVQRQMFPSGNQILDIQKKSSVNYSKISTINFIHISIQSPAGLGADERLFVFK
jgi:hypothetical protein